MSTKDYELRWVKLINIFMATTAFAVNYFYSQQLKQNNFVQWHFLESIFPKQTPKSDPINNIAKIGDRNKFNRTKWK